MTRCLAYDTERVTSDVLVSNNLPSHFNVFHFVVRVATKVYLLYRPHYLKKTSGLKVFGLKSTMDRTALEWQYGPNLEPNINNNARGSKAFPSIRRGNVSVWQ